MSGWFTNKHPSILLCFLEVSLSNIFKLLRYNVGVPDTLGHTPKRSKSDLDFENFFISTNDYINIKNTFSRYISFVEKYRIEEEWQPCLWDGFSRKAFATRKGKILFTVDIKTSTISVFSIFQKIRTIGRKSCFLREQCSSFSFIKKKTMMFRNKILWQKLYNYVKYTCQKFLWNCGFGSFWYMMVTILKNLVATHCQ